jgi:hypothetical protein
VVRSDPSSNLPRTEQRLQAQKGARGDQKKTAKAPAESEQAIAEGTAQGREEGEALRLRHSLAGELIP